MEKIENGGPAFPGQYDHGHTTESWTGMTLRQYAAIKLKVPDSGTDWLDAMIEKSLRDDFAAKAMQGIVQCTGYAAKRACNDAAECAYSVAESMFNARKGGAT